MVPWLETSAPVSPEFQPRLQDDQYRFTLVLDSEGYSPEFLSQMKQRLIARDVELLQVSQRGLAAR
jgi:hypothetical protein